MRVPAMRNIRQCPCLPYVSANGLHRCGVNREDTAQLPFPHVRYHFPKESQHPRIRFDVWTEGLMLSKVIEKYGPIRIHVEQNPLEA